MILLETLTAHFRCLSVGKNNHTYHTYVGEDFILHFA